jgi:DNA modification methylase
MNIKDIKLNSHNPRDITPEQFAKLKKSLQEFPQMLDTRPLVIDENNVVLGGNMRLRVLQDLGFEDVPVKQVTGWTEEQKKEFIVKDNLSYGMWDWEMLANEWDAEQLEDWGLEIPGFEEEELEAKEDNFQIPDEIQTDIQLGDIIEIGEHRLMCGDSTDIAQVEKLMNGEKADMVFTDPPYGMSLDTDYSKMPSTKESGNKNYNKVIGDNNDFTPELIHTVFACFDYCKEIFMWGADYYAEYLPHKNNGSWIVWDKRCDEKFDKMIGSGFELCWSKAKHKRMLARINNTLFSGEADARNKVHPTQKPIKLAEWFFNQWGNNNDVIVDLFLGSGSTMVASHQLNRKCYGMELDPKYCQVIVDRMKKLDPELVIKKNGELYISGN